MVAAKLAVSVDGTVARICYPLRLSGLEISRGVAEYAFKDPGGVEAMCIKYAMNRTEGPLQTDKDVDALRVEFTVEKPESG